MKEVWYPKNRIVHMKRARARNDRVIRELRALVDGIKVQSGCVDCGNRDVRVLDFDHDSKLPKVDSIGRMVAVPVSKLVLMAEIKKCKVRCSNCHRIITYERRQEMRGGVIGNTLAS